MSFDKKTITTVLRMVHSLTFKVTLIYHNISLPHSRRGPQRVSAASCLFPAPFPGLTSEKRP